MGVVPSTLCSCCTGCLRVPGRSVPVPCPRTLLASCLAAGLAGALTAVGALAGTPGKAEAGPLGMKFVPLPKGTFYMGWDGNKGSAKKTEIKKDFEIAVHTVTQAQWQAVMGNNP